MANQNSDRVTAAIPPRANVGETCMVDSVSLEAADLTLNAEHTFGTVPKGAVITDVILSSTDVDSATSVVFDVGITGDLDKFIDGTTIGRTGGVAYMNNADGFLYECTADTPIKLLVQAAPGTAVAGTVKIAVKYIMNDPLFA